MYGSFANTIDPCERAERLLGACEFVGRVLVYGGCVGRVVCVCECGEGGGSVWREGVLCGMHEYVQLHVYSMCTIH